MIKVERPLDAIWKQAPAWAKYATLDGDGWYYWQFKPELIDGLYERSTGLRTASNAIRGSIITRRPK